MATLLVYYSRSGKTKMICEKLAPMMGADLVEVREKKKRGLLSAFLSGAPVAIGRGVSKIIPVEADLTKYDDFIIATPVWAGHIVPAINAFLRVAGKSEMLTKKKIRALVTYSGGGDKMQAQFKEEIDSHNAKFLGAVLVDTSKFKPEMAEELAKTAAEKLAKLNHK
jgi:flavodoxin